MYEDYMQNLLGYRANPYQDIYEQYNQDRDYYNPNNCMNCMPNINWDYQNMNNEIDLENCYPEIYKMVYPMIKKVCMQNRERLTEENIEKMVDEVYNNIEAGDIINLNINIGNTVNAASENNKNMSPKVQNRGEIDKENRAPRNNYLLRDLIKILLLRELVGRPRQRPPFPPRPPYPPRPPVGRPPFPRY